MASIKELEYQERLYIESLTGPLAGSRRGPGEGWAVLCLSGAIYLATTYILVLRLDLLAPEVMWHTVEAWFVLSGDIARFTLVGPAVPPLPVLLELPLALLPPAVDMGFASGLLTAVLGALACVALSRTLVTLGVARGWRYPMVAAFALNPLILLHAGNGAPEMISLLLVVLSVLLVLDWHQSGNLQPLISLGFVVGLATLARFDALAYAALLAWVLWFLARSEAPATPGRVPGLLVAYAAPVLFCFFAWIVFSLLVPGVPQRMAQGGVLQVDLWVREWLYPVATSSAPGGARAVEALLGSLLTLSPLSLPVAALLLVDYYLTRNQRSLYLVAMALVFPVVQLPGFLLEQGGPSWRDFVLAIPFGIILSGQLMVRAAAVLPARGKVSLGLRALVVLALGVSTVFTGVAMVQPAEPDPRGALSLNAVATGRPADPWRWERAIARDLLGQVARESVLVDDREAYPIVFFTHRPEMFTPVRVVSAQRKAPAAAPVRYLLARSDDDRGVSATLTAQFESMYPEGADSPAVVREWPEAGWRLYRLPELKDGSTR